MKNNLFCQYLSQVQEQMLATSHFWRSSTNFTPRFLKGNVIQIVRSPPFYFTPNNIHGKITQF